MSKITKIPSEIRNFFSEKRRSAVMDTFTRLLENINLDCRILGGMKRPNCRLTNLQVFQILVLLPFFAVKGFSHYGGSALSRMFGGKKDMFYSYMSQDDINWRNVIYRITNWLVAKVVVRDDHKKSRLPAVLIADDTDLPKTGFQMESIGKIFSHVHQKCILGYKSLMLCWSDGRTQFMLDFSLHGEKGKIEGKEQGLTSAQRKRRYGRERDKDSHVARRKEEYFMSKVARLSATGSRSNTCWLTVGSHAGNSWILHAAATRSSISWAWPKWETPSIRLPTGASCPQKPLSPNSRPKRK